DDREAALVTVIESSTPAVSLGTSLLLSADGGTQGAISADLDSAARDAAVAAMHDGRSRVVALGDTARAFVEVARPPLRIVICGAGHDAIPLVRQASALGWRVTIADIRRTFLTNQRFP